MIDVRTISSTLEQLSDQGLQQYAQSHKEDPYVLALAVSESSRRQRMRQAAQAPQQPGPSTVAEEALSEMAPPAPTVLAGLGAGASAAAPQKYAEGGTLTSERLRDLEDARARYVRANADTSGIDQAIAAERNKLAPPVAAYGLGNEGRREAPFWGPTAAPAVGAAGLAAAAPTTPEPTAQAAPPARAGLAEAADVVLPQAAPRTGGAAPRGVTGAPQLGLDTDAMHRAAAERNAAVTSAARTAAEQDLADDERAQKERGVLGAGREARVKEQQRALEGRGEQAKRDALLQAGLAILSADPSKGAWSAIGTGALQGLQGYKGDMADLAKQRESLLDKLDELESLRRQEAVADGKERAAKKARIRQVEVEGAKLNADIGNKIDLDVKPQAALAVFKEQAATYRSNQENATRMAAARVSAAAGSRNQQLEMAQAYAKSAGIPLDRAIQEISQGKRAPVDVMAGYNDWAKANPMLAMGDPAQAVGAYLATSGALKAATQAVRVTDRPTGQLLSR